MKKSEIKVGKHYAAKVSGKMATVRIDAENPRGGWDAMNLRTNKKVHIKSSQRLRHETRAPGETGREQASAERAAGQVRKDIAKTVEAVRKGNLAKGIVVPAAKKDSGSKKASGKKRPSGLDAAAQVLADAKEPLDTKEMVARMLAKGLWKTGGKTPAATIYAAIIREIAAKGKDARFRKVERGKFELARTAVAAKEAV